GRGRPSCGHASGNWRRINETWSQGYSVAELQGVRSRSQPPATLPLCHPVTMMDLDTRRLVARMRTLESLALIPRVASTNLVARRIVNECIENELSLPQAMIVAGEQ